MSETTSANRRNVSVDLLKCISMLMVVILHITNSNPEYGLGTVSFSSAWQPIALFSNILRSFSLVAVDCFVLITGYFLCRANYNSAKAIKLWTTVFVYSFGFYLLICIVPFTDTIFTVKGIFENLLPVIHRRYWFFSCYFVLYLLSPFINKLIDNLSQSEFKRLLIILLVFFVAMTTAFADYLDANGGSTVFWFIILYLVAAYIRNYSLPNIKYGIVYVICSLVSFVILSLKMQVANQELTSYLSHLVSYNSIFVFGGAVSLFMVFLNHPILSQGKASKLIVKLSSLSFGVYLFHENPYLRPVIWQKVVHLQSYQNSVFMFILVMVLSVFVIFIVGIMTEWLRSVVFKRIDPIILKLFNKLHGDNKSYG